MKTPALRPFYINDKIGLFKFIDSPGYCIKLMGVGRGGVMVGECDDSFNLVSITKEDKKDSVLFALNKLHKVDRTLDFVQKVNRMVLTKHYKITKRLDMID